MEQAAPRGSLPDRLAGGLMLVGFVAMYGAWLWNVRQQALMFGDQVGRTPMFPTALGYLAQAFGLAATVWYSLGVYRGERWALVLAALASAQRLSFFFDALGRLKVDAATLAPEAFMLLIFVYCALRVVGTFGPQIVRILPARDESRYSE